MRVAVVGTGGAGLSAAYRLQTRHQVTLFEQLSHFGGHAHTVMVEAGPDCGLALDVGFMVFNQHNYRNFSQLLSELDGIELGDSDMSFSFSCAETGVEYAFNLGTKGSGNDVKTKQSSQKPSATLLSLLKDVYQFGKMVRADLADTGIDGWTVRDYIEQRKLSAQLVDLYLLPTGAAIWSTTVKRILDFPAKSYLAFIENHGLLADRNNIKWKYIKGGSQQYVQALLRKLRGNACNNTAVTRITRLPEGVELRLADGRTQAFDCVLVAVHADQALALLADPDLEEQRLLGCWRYQHSRAILHTDSSLMPRGRDAWASWNYRRSKRGQGDSLCVTYHLNRLQGHAHSKHQYFLTLNPSHEIEQGRVLKVFDFTHPTYDFAALQSQPLLEKLNGRRRTYYCGSYFGYGFHEDACTSGMKAAESLQGRS